MPSNGESTRWYVLLLYDNTQQYTRAELSCTACHNTRTAAVQQLQARFLEIVLRSSTAVYCCTAVQRSTPSSQVKSATSAAQIRACLSYILTAVTRTQQ